MVILKTFENAKEKIHGSFLYRVNMREKCAYSKLFWFAFSRIWTEYRDILRISPYWVQVRENADQNNSEYGHFLRSKTCGI